MVILESISFWILYVLTILKIDQQIFTTFMNLSVLNTVEDTTPPSRCNLGAASIDKEIENGQVKTYLETVQLEDCEKQT